MKRAVTILAITLSVAACGGGWSKSAGDTSCAEWIDDMSIDQRKGLSYAMLETLWKTDAAVTDPTLQLADAFANDIGRVCGEERTNMVNVAAGIVYGTDRGYQP